MAETVAASFNYSILEPEAAAIARQEALAILVCNLTLIHSVVDAGRRLIAVKTALPHGKFGPWLEAEFGWSERTAQNYMLAAESWGANPQRVAHLPLNVLYRLQSPSVPTTVREDVDRRIERGEQLTSGLVEDLLATARLKQRQVAEEAKKAANRRRWPSNRPVEEDDRQVAAFEAAALVRLYMQRQLAELLDLLERADALDFVAELKSLRSEDAAEIGGAS